MARKQKQSGKKRSTRKIQDAFQIAQRAENQGDSDNSGNESDDLVVRDGVMNARKFLGKGKEDQDGSDDDEEIDSDEALGSDDDYDVLNSKFSQTIRDKAKKAKKRARDNKRGKAHSDSDDSDEDEVYDSIDESQFVGLSEAWDMDDKDLAKVKQNKDKNGELNDVVLDDKWESESSQESESESESEDEEEENESDSDVFGGFGSDDEDVDLAQTVSNLQSQLKKPTKERKRLMTEKSEENEFNLPTKGNKLSLTDMMSGIETNDAILLNTANDGAESSASATLTAPLPKRIQERHDRKVAYEITKEEVSKWEDTVKQNRQAEVLLFPMNPTVKHNDSAVTFKSDNKPTTELEQKVHSLLTESALLDDKKEATFEEIATAKMSVEDLKKRNSELRLMRELMFREEKRAKRIKKIKSKQYHKIQKKARLRNQEMVEGSDMESDGEEHDIKRAQERMSLKHKTQSQWAKSMIKSGLSKDADNRGELEEMLRQGERLRAKQLGYEDGDQDDRGVSDIEAAYDDDQEEDDANRSKLGKGVLNMDFMKAADKRAKAENLKELEFLRKMEEGDGLEDFEDGESNSININKNQGRRVYTPNASAMKDDVNTTNSNTREEVELDNAKSLSNKLSKKYNVVDSKDRGNKQVQEEVVVETTSSPQVTNNAVTEANDSDELNPWMTVNSNEPMQKSKKITVVDKDSSKVAKSAQRIAKKGNKRSSSTMDAEDTVIDMDQTLKIVDAYGDDENEDVGGNHMFKQKELIKEAFAGDDVVKEFEAEKRQVIVDEDDKEEDLTLPGWGDWAVSGKKNKKKKVVKKIDGVVQKDKRKDKNLKNVIINEKVNKKNLKYQSSAVPFPYESREQYERALRMPVGQEWTSRETHQKLTMPRVITKQGTVIDPLKAPFK